MSRDDVFPGERVEKPDGTLEWVEYPEPGRRPEFDPSDDECVDDPEALKAAEEAVARDEEESPHREPIDERWVPMARAAERSLAMPAAFFSELPLSERLRLQVMADALGEAGIDVGWDPYPPGEVFSHQYRVARAFQLLVPESQAEDARRVLEREFPDDAIGRDATPAGYEAEGPPPGYEPEGRPDDGAGSAHELATQAYRWAVWAALALGAVSLLAGLRDCAG